MQPVEGYLDGADNGELYGWARSLTDPGLTVTVSIFHGAEHLGDAPANLFREDLRRAGIGNSKGLYGFTFRVPERVRSLNRYSCSARVNGAELAGSPLEVFEDAAHPFRREGSQVRDFLAEQYLTGNGMEVGALHNPVKVADGAKVTYVDTRSREELLAYYPEIQARGAIAVDLVTDGHTLDVVADCSQDFFVANQVLEHLENPLLALENMLRVLKPRGVLFLSLPDKRHTFDIDRPVTTFEHVLKDYMKGPEWSREEHYREWIRLVEKIADPEQTMTRLDFLMNQQKYPIHFHVWTQWEMLDLFAGSRGVLSSTFEMDCCKANGYEVLFVLRKL